MTALFLLATSLLLATPAPPVVEAKVKPPAAAPQLASCPSVVFWHGAKVPNATRVTEGKYDWVTPANNALAIGDEPLSLAEVAETALDDVKGIRDSLCGNGKTCASKLVQIDGNLEMSWALAVPVPTKAGSEPAFVLHEPVCDTIQTESISIDCTLTTRDRDILALSLSVTGRDDEESTEWTQLFDRHTGKLLLTANKAIIYLRTDDVHYIVEGCGAWTKEALLAGGAPNAKIKTWQGSKQNAKRIQAGRKATKAGDYGAATKAFQEVLERDPYSLKARSGLGYAQLKAGKHNDAVATFNGLLNQHGKRLDATFRKQVLHNLGLAEKALGITHGDEDEDEDE
ncbi:MAG: hypothetical protein ACI9MR_000760 [Myxococcota bacterium]|jgi:hypothetical protein